jgi:hypothetical protein
MQLTVDARCVCGAASHVVTALKRLASAVEVSGCLGGAVAEGVATGWRDHKDIISSVQHLFS